MIMVGFRLSSSLSLLFVVLVVFLHTTTTVVRSELPPWIYDGWKKNAENYVFIQILNDTYIENDNKVRNENNYNRNEDCYKVHYTVRAKILQVNRTTTTIVEPLNEGDAISFSTWYRNYSMFGCRGFVGPSSPDLFSENWCGWAYLNSTTGGDSAPEDIPSTYTLAAGGYSFEKRPCPYDDNGDDSETGGEIATDPSSTTITIPIDQQTDDESNPAVILPDDPSTTITGEDEIIVNGDADKASGEAMVSSDQVGGGGDSSNDAETTATAIKKTANNDDSDTSNAAATSLRSFIFLATNTSTTTTTVVITILSSLLSLILVEY